MAVNMLNDSEPGCRSATTIYVRVLRLSTAVIENSVLLGFEAS